MADYLKIPEVARRLDVSEKTARRYVKAGVLPSTFIGGAYRVTEEDLEEFIHRSEVKPETPKAERRSPSEPSFNDVLAEERRSSVFAGAIMATARKAIERGPADSERSAGVLHGIARVMIDLVEPLLALTDEPDTWEQGRSAAERQEILDVARELLRASAHSIDQTGDYLQDRQAEELREQIRERTRRIA